MVGDKNMFMLWIWNLASVHGNHDIGHMGLKLSWQTFTNLIWIVTLTTQIVSIFRKASYPNISLGRKRTISVLGTYITLWKPFIKFQTDMNILITNLLGQGFVRY